MNTHMSMRIEILVAVFRPNPAYLAAQLSSLAAQDYPNLTITLLDDSADDTAHAQIAAIAKEVLAARPYRLLRNAENLGVRRTFGRLTEMAEGDLLAYCDQDDIWQPEKLSRLAALLSDDGTARAPYSETKGPNTHPNPSEMAAGTARPHLAYCNQSIIDAGGRERYPTLQAMNPRFTHKSGAGLFPYFLQDNCVTGCTMMLRRETAQSALPFPDAYIHDQWLALCAAARGPIAYDPVPLIGYRLHGENVIGMDSLSGVTDRKSYVSERLIPQLAMLNAAKDRFTDADQQAEIDAQTRALAKRIAYLEHRRLYHLPSLIGSLWRDPLRLGLEALLGIAPHPLEKRIIAFAKRH